MTAKGSTYSSVNTTKDSVERHIRSFPVQNIKSEQLLSLQPLWQGL